MKYLGLFFFFLLACATSPEGRRQLILLPDSEVEQMGVSSFNQLKSQQPIERAPVTNKYVKCVAMEVLKEAQGYANRKDWEIVVFKSDEANAFALPGGKIGVYTGILKYAKNQDQLAAVLGHEIGHVIARHGNERMSEALAAQGVLVATDFATQDNAHKNLIMAALGMGAQFGYLLPHSRTQESEADIIGLGIMARAGFNPQEAVELWKNMSAIGGAPPELLSTHPSSANRIENLKAHMAPALVWSQQAQAAGRKPNCKL
jgi:predicted Zn-dependent protease